jgi:hypothetical protein
MSAFRIIAPKERLVLYLCGYRYVEDKRIGLQDFRLTYHGVLSFQSNSNPDKGFAGSAGYGDLAFDEFEVLQEGLFEHRMIFSTGIEIAVQFKGFSYQNLSDSFGAAGKETAASGTAR